MATSVTVDSEDLANILACAESFGLNRLKRRSASWQRLSEALNSVGVPTDQGCEKPPVGWYCSRKPGHEGPCAARQTRTE